MGDGGGGRRRVLDTVSEGFSEGAEEVEARSGEKESVMLVRLITAQHWLKSGKKWTSERTSGEDRKSLEHFLVGQLTTYIKILQKKKKKSHPLTPVLDLFPLPPGI